MIFYVGSRIDDNNPEGVLVGRFVEDLPESTQEMVESQTKQYYSRFQPLDR